jgi:hypothetical protein
MESVDCDSGPSVTADRRFTAERHCVEGTGSEQSQL